MIRFSKLLFVFIVTFLALWLVPWFYHFVTDTPAQVPFTLYSTVVKDFAHLDYSEDHGIRYMDRKGNRYTDRQFDSILPMFYYRQLASDGRMPDSINGVAVNPRIISMSNFIWRQSASDINVRKTPLYPLLESMSGRVDLKLPDDVCRFTEDGLQFIDMATNTVNGEKSGLFTSLMKKKGFEFPMTCIGGNPTDRKDYDNGYFLTDARGRLFHLKQVCGRPFFREVPLPEGVEVRHIMVQEFVARKFHALLTDQHNRFWTVAMPGYGLHRLPVGTYDPQTEDAEIFGNMFNWTVVISRQDGVNLYALDADDYSLLDTMSYRIPESAARKAGRWIFPCEIRLTSYDDQYVYPRLEEVSARGLWLPLLVIAGCILGRRRRRR